MSKKNATTLDLNKVLGYHTVGNSQSADRLNRPRSLHGLQLMRQYVRRSSVNRRQSYLRQWLTVRNSKIPAVTLHLIDRYGIMRIMLLRNSQGPTSTRTFIVFVWPLAGLQATCVVQEGGYDRCRRGNLLESLPNPPICWSDP